MSALVAEPLPQLLAPEVELDPGAYYKTLRDLDTIRYDDSSGAYLLVRHEDVSAAYRNPIFTTQNYAWQLEPVMGRTLLQLSGTEHAKVRGLLSPSFRGHGLNGWLGPIEQNVAGILDATVIRTLDGITRTFRPGEEVDLVRDFARYFPVYVIADILGLPKSDHGRFYGWYTAQSAFLSNLARDPVVEEAGIRATADLRDYLGPLVAARRADPRDDFISMLASSEIDGVPLTDEEVMTHATHLLNAGSETTDRTIANLFTHLLTRRERYEEVRADRSLVIPAISETLRMTPPSQMNGRVTTEDVEIRGVHIPAGSLVMIVMASANRDERRFRDPDTWDMYRTDLNHANAFTGTGEHFAFGYGRHFCLGAMVAQKELETTLNVFLDRFPDLRLARDEHPVSRGIKMRSPVELPVVL